MKSDLTKPVVGAQIYTLREFCKTPPEIERTLKKVKDIGYSVVQLSGLGPVDPSNLAEIVAKSGLVVGATHTAWSRFHGDLDNVIIEHRLLKCRHLAIGGLPGEYLSLDGLRRFIKEEQSIGERLAREGMTFSYHNHGHEFMKPAGATKTWLEMLYEESDPALLKAELDTYWVQTGGGDPAEWVRMCAGREPLLHLKDMSIGPDCKQRMAEIGNGNMNWPAILKAAEAGGVEYLLVEQDECYGADPFESLAISYRFLGNMGYS